MTQIRCVKPVCVVTYPATLCLFKLGVLAPTPKLVCALAQAGSYRYVDSLCMRWCEIMRMHRFQPIMAILSKDPKQVFDCLCSKDVTTAFTDII